MSQRVSKPSPELMGEGLSQRSAAGGGRHWYRITGLPGWQRARLRIPAFGDAHCTDHRKSEPPEIESCKSRMKIAIPTEDGHLHGHFGGCRQFALVEVNPETRETLRMEIIPAPEHQPGLFPRWLGRQGVEVVIMGGVGRRALANFAQQGVSVRAGLPGEPVEAQVTAFLEGRLTETPEDCGHHHHHDHDHDHDHHHQHHHPQQDKDRGSNASRVD
jgi:predicted Fe-Mo cluster-binding NifX family protein